MTGDTTELVDALGGETREAHVGVMIPETRLLFAAWPCCSASSSVCEIDGGLIVAWERRDVDGDDRLVPWVAAESRGGAWFEPLPELHEDVTISVDPDEARSAALDRHELYCRRMRAAAGGGER